MWNCSRLILIRVLIRFLIRFWFDFFLIIFQFWLNTYSFIYFIRYHEHEVDDDVVTCETVQDEKCEDVTQGYTTEQKCTKWPREVCTQETQTVLKYSPETDCRKVPRDLCGPSGCVLQPGPEECFDKKETVISEVHHCKYLQFLIVSSFHCNFVVRFTLIT